MTGPTVHHGFWWALNLGVFPCRRSSILSLGPRKGLRTAVVVSFVFGEPAEGFGSLLYVTMNCFLTCLRYDCLRC